MTQVTSASEFRKKAKQGIELPLPSGNVCLVRPRPGIDAFIRKGFIPNSLMPAVKKALTEGEAAFNMSALKDPKTGEVPENLIEDMLGAMDNVLVSVVLEPQVRHIPFYQDENGNLVDETGSPVDTPVMIPEEKRDLDEDGNRKEVDWLYADEVDFEDKSFIFGWSMGGTADYEQFRREQASIMESV